MPPDSLILVTVTLFGLVIGSFLSVCIYRIPLGRTERYDGEGNPLPDPTPDEVAKEKLSIAKPARSLCPHCRTQLLWWHNIPVFSWLILRGRCHFCKASISARYPIVELMSALSALLAYSLYGLTPTAAVVYIFAATLIVISFIDYDYFIIPNIISIPGFFIALALALLNHFTGWFHFPIAPSIWSAFFGVLVGAGFLLFVSEVYLRLRKKEGLGMGDVKLLAMTGALLGPQAAIYTIFVGSLLGSIIGVALILIAGRKMSHHLPFGPYLACASLMYVFGLEDLLAVLGLAMARLLGTGG